MPTYKLFYFEGRGRAELTRWLFAAGDIEYEDIRLAGEKWQEFKPNTPFGQMPCLEVDGELICQGNTMARFIATRAGFAGKDEMEKVRANMYVDCVEDMLKPLFKIFFTKDEAEKAAATKAFDADQKPGFLEKFEGFLSNNKTGYLVGSGLTWADMSLVQGLTWVDKVSSTDYSKYPLIKELNNKVTSEPKIAAWIAKRPASDW